MRMLAALLMVVAPAPAIAAEIVCLSIDGQVRADFAGPALSGVTLRVPADGERAARVLRLQPADVVVETLSEGGEQVTAEGCDGAASGALAVVLTTTRTTRRLRIGFPGGGAFPSGIAGRSSDGDTLERELTCTQSTRRMAKCP